MSRGALVRCATAAVLALLPAALLHPALRGDRVLIPYDPRVFPPASLELAAPALADLRRTANFDITETTLVHAPEIRFAQSELARGRFPAWDPYVRCGAPLFATTSSGFAHPLHLHHLAMDPERAFAVTAWLSIAMASLLMLGLLRELELGAAAAVLGAVTFAWSGTMMARLHLYTHYSTLLWLPGMLWAIERLRHGGGGRAMAGLAISTAALWTAGYPPAALAASLVAGAWLALRPAPGGVAAAARGFARAGIALALGAGLAAYALWPMLAYFGATGRVEDAELLALRRARAFDPAGWLNFLLESPFSTPALNREGGVPHNKAPLFWLLHSRAGEASVVPQLQYTETRVYLGALPILLIPLALGRRAFVWAALVLAAVLLLLASGREAYDWLCAVLPPVRFLQPIAFVAPLPCLLAIAAAAGFDRLLDAACRRRRRLLLILAAVLAAGCASGALLAKLALAPDAAQWFLRGMAARWGDVYRASGDERVQAFFAPTLRPALELLIGNLWLAAAGFGAVALLALTLPRAPRVLAAAAIAATAAELIAHAWPLNACHAPQAAAASPVHAFLRGERARLAAAGGFTVARVAAVAAATGTAVPEVPTALPPNGLIAERIRDLNSYTFLDGRSHLGFRRLYDSRSPSLMIRGLWLSAFPDDELLAHPLFDLYGVRYLLCFAPPDRLPPRHAGREVLGPIAGAEGTFHVYERPHPCPRAFVVPRATVAGDDAAVLDALVSQDFDPRAAVLLPASEADRMPRAAPGSGGGEVRFALDEATHLMLDVKGSGGGLLVLTDTWLPGWSAVVHRAGGDSTPAPVLRGDLCFRAIPIPAGDSRVELRYRPPGLIPGVLATLIAAAILGGLAARRRERLV